MNRLSNVIIELFGREYDLAFGRGASGATWLLLVNRQTEAALPVTPLDVRPTPVSAVEVYDVDGIVPALEAVGVLRRIGPAERSIGLASCRCEIVSTELLRRLSGLDAHRERDAPAREGMSR